MYVAIQDGTVLPDSTVLTATTRAHVLATRHLLHAVRRLALRTISP